jgi:hypothetical protein
MQSISTASEISERSGMVIALAGRRVDPPRAAEPRLPPENLALVKERIREKLMESEAATLVCSAACGADLLALEAAGELGAARHVVLPFAREAFRRLSVTDRPGDWGERYDRVLDEVEQHGHLTLLGCSEDDPEAYAIASRTILEHAMEHARRQRQSAAAVVVWNLKSRGPGDSTEYFMKEAEARKLKVIQVSTLTECAPANSEKPAG